MILLLSMADSHNVDQSGRVNRHEIPLFSKIDSHAMNRYHWVTETQIGSVPKKPDLSLWPLSHRPGLSLSSPFLLL